MNNKIKAKSKRITNDLLMMTTIKLLLLFFCFCVFRLNAQWSETANHPGNERDDAVAFSIGTTAYVLTGNQAPNQYSAMIYRLPYPNEVWQEVTLFPGEERQYATAFSIGNKAYLIGGINLNGLPLNDVWEFDETTMNWQQLDDFPGEARWGMSSTSFANKGYVLGGTNENATTNEFWEFNQLDRSWKKLANKPGLAIREGTLEHLHGEIVAIGGFSMPSVNCSNEVYSYSIINQSWSKKSNFPSVNTSYLASASYNNTIYVASGWSCANEFGNVLWSFNGEIWNIESIFPEAGIRGMSACSVNNTLIFTGGLQSNLERSATTYLYKVAEINDSKPIIYPNPSNGTTYIETKFGGGNFIIYSAYGQVIQEISTQQQPFALTLKAGCYFMYDLDSNNYYSFIVN